MRTKLCKGCNQNKPYSDYHIDRQRGRPRTLCKVCRNAQNNRWNQSHSEAYRQWHRDYRQRVDVKARKNERARERYASDPDYRANLLARHKLVGYLYSLKKVYGLTVETYLDMLDSQGRCCKICNCDLTALGYRADNTTYLRAHVDHDHVTGKVRGLLCSECNVGLGKFADDAALLRAAADYLAA